MSIKESCENILKKSTLLLADVEQNTAITFHDTETVELLGHRFRAIVSALGQLKTELVYKEKEDMEIGKAVVELIDEIDSGRVKYFTNNREDEFVESETIDAELENIIHCMLIPMQRIYKKYSKQEKNLPGLSKQHETSGDEKSENDFVEENHLKTKINYELLSELEILDVEKLTKKLTNVLLTVQYEKCSNISNVSQKIVRILPILEQYHLFCKFYLMQQIGAHKVSTKMLSVMLTVFVELGSKVGVNDFINVQNLLSK